MFTRTKFCWLIIFLVTACFFATWLWNSTGHNIPVYVIGELPEHDVAEIVEIIKHELRWRILPSISWRSIRELPRAIKKYANTKLITIYKERGDFVAVNVWSKTNGLPLFHSPTNYVGQTGPTSNGFIYDSMAKTGADLIWVKKTSSGWIEYNFYFP